MIGAGHGEKLSRKQDALILALLTSPTIKQAAHKAGISEPTARRWLKEASFQTAYREASRATFDQAIVSLQQLAVSAVVTLARNLKPEVPPAVQVRAATAILEHAREAEMQEILERLERLEAMLDQPTPARRLA